MNTPDVRTGSHPKQHLRRDPDVVVSIPRPPTMRPPPPPEQTIFEDKMMELSLGTVQLDKTGLKSKSHIRRSKKNKSHKMGQTLSLAEFQAGENDNEELRHQQNNNYCSISRPKISYHSLPQRVRHDSGGHDSVFENYITVHSFDWKSRGERIAFNFGAAQSESKLCDADIKAMLVDPAFKDTVEEMRWPVSREFGKWELHIDFSGNQLTCDGVISLLDYARQNAFSVRHIRLYRNSIGDRGAQAIAKYINEAEWPVEEVHLSHNRISATGLLAIMNSAEKRSDLYPRRHPSGNHYVPLWLRLEWNVIQNVDIVVNELHKSHMICEGKNQQRCTASSCAAPLISTNHPKIHVPGLRDQRKCGQSRNPQRRSW